MMPRFVVLRHDSPRGLHWDLMLETGAALATWALAEEPQRGKTCLADALAEHRLAYLEHEGPIGRGRGQVTRWDRGVYTTEEQRPRALSLTVAGKKLQGRVTLSQSAGEPASWQFRWE